MTAVNTSAASGSANSASQRGAGDLRDLGMDDFLKLLIAEMQNQDPLDPMKNSEMLQQISQIRSIGATNELSDTLGSISDGQNISTASSLIGKQVQALTDDGLIAFGVVNSVQITPDANGVRQLELKINTGEEVISAKLEDVFTILPSSADNPEADSAETT
ncbi:MAG: flagellar biosynthesis protein FlgD [Blastopirellula sp.]|nr:MAG: flagellar biosynthesis protein FlgD [Blastopirellula sp.]